MVLTFGGTQPGGAEWGQRLARAVNESLTGGPGFEGAAFREFHDLGRSNGEVAIEVYLFNREVR